MPMGMKSSGFERQAELKENYVTSYLQKGKQLIPYKPNFQLFYPAGAMSFNSSRYGALYIYVIVRSYFTNLFI